MENDTPEILIFHCPRWNELPDLDLYMDQVVSVIEKYLSIFSDENGEKIITPTMINNYVKQKIIHPPERKKYNRIHLAYLFIFCILKRILSISEICDLITYLTRQHTVEQAYDLFCDELEKAIQTTFSGRVMTLPEAKALNDQELTVLQAAVLAFSNKLFFQYEIKTLTKISEEVEEGKK